MANEALDFELEAEAADLHRLGTSACGDIWPGEDEPFWLKPLAP